MCGKKKDNNKKAFEKVKRNVLCSDYDQGGLKMIDVKQMQTSFLLQWVIRLTKYSSSDKSTVIPRMIFSSHGKNFECLHSNVNSKSFKGLNHIKSKFWSTVLRTWLDNNTSSNDIKFNPMLWNNKYFVYGGNVLFFKDWAEKGIVRIEDVLYENQILTYQNICDIIGYTANRILEYNVVYAVVKRFLTYNTLPALENQINLNHPPMFRNKEVKRARQFREIMISSLKSKACSINF